MEQDRDFRSWQQQLERDRLGWEAARHDNGALLRGSALSTAEEWLAGRADDIPEAHRRYVAASRQLRRREVRRWRAVTAVVTVLALVAASTAVVAYRTNQERAAQLRLQAGISMSRDVMRVADSDPITALQLAQGAAANAPGHHETEAALLRLQIGLSGLASYTPRPWTAPAFTGISGDGSVVLIVGKDRSLTIWRGVLDGHPTAQSLPPPATTVTDVAGVSQDGHRFALITAKGGVLLWDNRKGLDPITVRPDRDRAAKPRTTLGMLSSDGTRLVLSDDPDRRKNPATNRPIWCLPASIQVAPPCGSTKAP